jgi:pimeloyl-ACP methyl ester carboxylesterase
LRRLLAATVLAFLAAGPAWAQERLELVDPARGRPVPTLLYGAQPGVAKPLAVISNGYGGSPANYRFLAEALAARGYVVASVRQDLPGDPPMATEGDLRVLRRPFWETGADTILYLAGALRARGLADTAPLVLVGHSNGGDISMLFAERHPAMVRAVLSLDNRRMPLPRTARPRVCSVRASDFPADPGVLPTAEEQARLGILVTTVPGLKHNDMWDGAAPEHKAAMLAALDACLDGVR